MMVEENSWPTDMGRQTEWLMHQMHHALQVQDNPQ
jgi:hypothetical protein